MKHKFHAVPERRGALRFDSKLEARYWDYLQALQAKGDVVGVLRQVPIHLSGGRLVVDFLVFTGKGDCLFIDTKGVETETFRFKRRALAAEYPWLKLHTVKAVPPVAHASTLPANDTS